MFLLIIIGVCLMNRLDLEDRLVDFADRYPRLGLFVGLSYFATGFFYLLYYILYYLL